MAEFCSKCMPKFIGTKKSLGEKHSMMGFMMFAFMSSMLIGFAVFIVGWNAGWRPDNRGYNTDNDVCKAMNATIYASDLNARFAGTGNRAIFCIDRLGEIRAYEKED